MALTPMTLTARLIKHHHQGDARSLSSAVRSEKLEAMRTGDCAAKWRTSFLTFEEMVGIFDARHVDLESLCLRIRTVSTMLLDGRNFAVSGGVANAVVNVIKEYPDREVKITNAEGLRECRKMMMAAKAGKFNGYLLEGMACPGGCVAGAGTMQPIKSAQVGLYAKQAGTPDRIRHRVC